MEYTAFNDRIVGDSKEDNILEIIVVSVSALITLFVFRKIFIMDKNSRKNLGESLIRIFYLIIQMLPVCLLSTLDVYIDINPGFFAILWIIWFSTIDKLLTRKQLINADINTKKALIFLALLTSALVFMVQGIIDDSYEYKNMSYVAFAAMVGFFVPIDVIFSGENYKEKFNNVCKGTCLAELNSMTKLCWIAAFVLMEVSTILEKENYGEAFYFGVVVGGIIAVFCLSMKKSDEIAECTDFREKVFDSPSFIVYKEGVEKVLGLSGGEKYDLIEAFLLYEVFATKTEHNEIVFETEKRKFEEISKGYDKYKVCLKNNKYILKKERKEYTCECFFDAWGVLLFYLVHYSDLDFEDGDFPLETRIRYDKWGYWDKKEKWLLFFLENYHSLSKHNKKKVIHNDINRLFYYVYEKEAFLIVPTWLGLYINSDFKGFEILNIAYKWFNQNNITENMEDYLKGYLKNYTRVRMFEAWLNEYADWTDFVVSNRLSNFVEKKVGINKQRFGPPKIKCFSCEGNKQKVLLKDFKTISKLIYYR